jgi:hypothetical protein
MYKLYQKLLEKDLRSKIIKVFNVLPNVADWSHEIDDKLSVWITDNMLKELSKLVGVKPEVLAKEDILKEYPEEMSELKSRFVSVRDYLKGSNESGNAVDFKNSSFTELYDNSVAWHNSLRGSLTRSIEEVEQFTMIKQYPPKPDGTVFYWADLGVSFSKVEKERMGHCGDAPGNTLISLRSYKDDLSGSKIRKSHVTIAVKNSGNAYTQAKGKQNRKPSNIYRDYIYDLFTVEPRINKFIPTYKESMDWKVTDFTPNQIDELYKVKPNLVGQFISGKDIEEADKILNSDPEEIYTAFKSDGFKWGNDGLNDHSKLIVNALFKVISKNPIWIEDYLRVVSSSLNDNSHSSYFNTYLLYFIETLIFENSLGKNLNLVKNVIFRGSSWKRKQHHEILKLAELANSFPDYFSSFVPYEELYQLYKNDFSEDANFKNTDIGQLILNYAKRTPKLAKFYKTIELDSELEILESNLEGNGDYSIVINSIRECYNNMLGSGILNETETKKLLSKRIINYYGVDLKNILTDRATQIVAYKLVNNQDILYCPKKLENLMAKRREVTLETKDLFEMLAKSEYKMGEDLYMLLFEDEGDYQDWESPPTRDMVSELDSLDDTYTELLRAYLRKQEGYSPDFEDMDFSDIFDEMEIPDDLLDLLKRASYYAQDMAYSDSKYKAGVSYIEELLEATPLTVIDFNLDHINGKVSINEVIRDFLDNVDDDLEILSNYSYDSVLNLDYLNDLEKITYHFPNYGYDSYYSSKDYITVLQDNWEL